ncbi:alpha/beta hydrolase [Actinoplanes sp. DH11]|uniref:alpha/beta hydrolase n=1 Tax=Actinoplanes sp. DH11 TaxID=2857011 RepID=UPI001E504D5A|nr:alpha/beta hydrolase [Actinoplanes sp. DH11]
MSRVLLLRGMGVLLALILILALAWSLQRKLIYFPERTPPPLPPGATAVTLRTADGLRLSAWLLEPPPGTPDRALAALVAHGNGGNLAGRMPLGTALAGLGLTVLLLEYRGYGGNPGSPTETGLAADADAAQSYLAALGKPIIYYGESLGAAVVTALAVRRPPAGLVLRSPFRSLAAAGGEHYPWLPVGLLLRDRYPVTSLISQVTAPTVVIYGTADSVVPAAQSADVASRAARLIHEEVVEAADHNDRVLLDGRPILDAVRSLLTVLPH